ncbi:fimbrial protein [Escherichia sp. E2748]|uniref:fimbrial protein n=1 Tax=Escherichia sp. E2748 TaxID=2044460 RepID=UPI001436C5E3|nr:fimbrial protein [Escherichia sp. E2748]
MKYWYSLNILTAIVTMGAWNNAIAIGKPAHIDVYAEISETTCDISVSNESIVLGTFSKNDFAKSKTDVGTKSFDLRASNCTESGSSQGTVPGDGGVYAEVLFSPGMGIPGEPTLWSNTGINDVGVVLKGHVYDFATKTSTVAEIKNNDYIQLATVSKGDVISSIDGKQTTLTASLQAINANTASAQHIKVPVDFMMIYQ